MTGARIAAVAVALALVGGPSAHAAVPSGNLVRNPGAEDGPGAQDTSTVPVPGWATTGSFTAVAYGDAPGFLGPIDGGGAGFFAGGDGSEAAQAVQEFDVAPDAGLIDQCRVSATASGWFGGAGSQGDSARAEVAFLGADRAVIGTGIQIGNPTVADRGGASGYRSYTQTARVVPGTRVIRFTVIASRTDGTYNDGYADNLSLALAESAAPAGGVAQIPEAGRSVVVTRVRGTVTIRNTLVVHVSPGSCLGEDDLQTIIDAVALLLVFKPEVDATRGEVAMTAAQDAKGAAETARFSKGAFKVAQKPAVKPVTELTLSRGDFSKCRGRGRGSAQVARRLVGTGKGRFRTRGRYSTATVDGATWRTEDRCDGTLTTVPASARGSEVVVRDLVKRRNVKLHAGQSYLARSRR